MTVHTLTDDEAQVLADYLRQFVQMSVLISMDQAEALVRNFDGFDTIMPILDPTRWQREHKDNDRMLRLARAFLTFRGELEKLRREDA